jgi:hypothetical protein
MKKLYFIIITILVLAGCLPQPQHSHIKHNKHMLDTLPTSAFIDTVRTPLRIPNENLTNPADTICHYSINFKDSIYNVVLHLNKSDYAFYKSLPKNQPYQNFLYQFTEHEYVQDVIVQLHTYTQGFTSYETGQFLISFIQQAMPYHIDPPNYNEYPKYLIETLIESGDCEDKAIALVTTLLASNYRAILLEYPNHIALAVNLPDEITTNGSYYMYDNLKFFFIESTNSFEIGEMQNENYREATILPLHPPFTLDKSYINNLNKIN